MGIRRRENRAVAVNLPREVGAMSLLELMIEYFRDISLAVGILSMMEHAVAPSPQPYWTHYH